MKKKFLISLLILLIAFIITVAYILYILNYFPHKKYTNKDFNIETYISSIDKDNDGIDDQTDILNNVRKYIISYISSYDCNCFITRQQGY